MLGRRPEVLAGLGVLEERVEPGLGTVSTRARRGKEDWEDQSRSLEGVPMGGDLAGGGVDMLKSEGQRQHKLKDLKEPNVL